MTPKMLWRAGATLLGGLVILLLGGCEIDSAETVYRDVPIYVSGFYSNPDGGRLVSNSSGSPVTQMNVRQTGDHIEAVDNNGVVYRGTLGAVTANDGATFTLYGTLPNGHEVTITGRFLVSGTNGTMEGTWIEPDRTGLVYGTAQVPDNTPDNNNGGDVSITPSQATLEDDGDTQVFIASGGTAPYAWTLSSTTRGALSSNAGTQVTYTRQAAGNNTITVRDSQGNSRSAGIVQPDENDDSSDDFDGEGPPLPG